VPRAIPRNCLDLLDLQHGVIARWQAPYVQLDSALMDTRLRFGRWQPLYRGVYATFTGCPSRKAMLYAATLRGGPGAVLSYQTAAELDGIADEPAEVIHVTVGLSRQVRVGPRETAGRLPAITVHRSGRIDDARHPTRTPPRTRIEETVLDLAQAARDPEDAFSWAARACGRRLTTSGLLLSAMEARKKMRWRPELTAGLGEVSQGVLSVLERRYVRHVEQPHGLPRAIRQSRSHVGGRTRYLDNHYRSFRLVVELDGQIAHPAEARWRDVHRDNASATTGLVTLRYSWTDVTMNPCAVAAEIAAALSVRGWPGPLRRCLPTCGADFSVRGDLSVNSTERSP
jgi:Protein of unknown function (DUF559)